MQLTRRLDANWDMTFGRGLENFARDSEATQQNIRSRLMLIMGEWFLDTTAGVPYLPNDAVPSSEALTRKPADLPYLEAVLKQTVLDTDGVDSIENFSMSYDANTRKLTVTVSYFDVYSSTSNLVQVQI